MRKAKDRIDRDYAESLSVEVLAAEAHCSRYHFMRSFQAAYGEPPGLYLTRRRIERAKDLLRSANLTVTEICFVVGFGSLGSFSRRFSELVGLSPTAYRDRSRVRSAAPIPGCFVLMWNRPSGPRTSGTFREATPGVPD
ncbi:MAG TPA: AraC family transcriptional regulator [Pseudonocardiaceae bacterium]|nr:AraC family transcriptional regulator [Pseudonocardiaceae bacterium]